MSSRYFETLIEISVRFLGLCYAVRIAGDGHVSMPAAESRRAPACTDTEDALMDLDYYRQREAAERVSAETSASPEARHAHLELAERYRGVIEAYERLGGLQASAA